MAGIVTHMLVCEGALDSGALNQRLSGIASLHAHWMRVGAMSPDMPYVAVLGGQNSWADEMHYRNTHLIIQRGLSALQDGWDDAVELNCEKFAWLLGYASHVFTDAVVHPVVECIVGPYTDPATRSNHKVCEKVQDSLLYSEIRRGLQITHGESLDGLRNCRASDNYERVLSFWKDLILSAYGGTTPEPSPQTWLDIFIDAVDTTDNHGGFTAAFRHAGVLNPETLVYTAAEELRETRASWCRRYYDNVSLPYNRVGQFKRDVFDKAAGVLVEKWNQMYDVVNSSAPGGTVAQNWNLDTGRVQDQTNELTFWRA